MRVINHPILGEKKANPFVPVYINGKEYFAYEGEMIAAVMMANGLLVHRYTTKKGEPRGIFCGIGQCTDCVMVVDGKPNVRTCITPVESGMKIETQYGFGEGKQQK
jgi:predicted molibdopterin-dependent oxidoreductase YjgC